MTLEEAFILTCHTGYISDASFLDDYDGVKWPSQLFLDKCAEFLERDVHLDEFTREDKYIMNDLKEKSYNKWMEIVNEPKESKEN
ncbi:MAG: hypothetical protein GY707_05610 [Desulfobacteraceae bacterium]|nr:hypothetical protein [Desulfobacteraceae bacterium]